MKKQYHYDLTITCPDGSKKTVKTSGTYKQTEESFELGLAGVQRMIEKEIMENKAECQNCDELFDIWEDEVHGEQAKHCVDCAHAMADDEEDNTGN